MDTGIRDLIKAGVQFGHRTSRWNPKMAPYILKKRNLIHLIDLKETLRGLITGAKLISVIAERGEYVLFAGTKRAAQSIVRKNAKRCGMPYVADRWPGGLLTNYVTIRSRLERLIELEQLEESGEIQNFSKKMISSLRREQAKIERNLGGVRDMDRLPGALVIVDPVREYIAADEANKLDIPSVALVDTNGDPDAVDVVVPGNDDAIGAINIFVKTMADAVLEGRKRAEGGEIVEEEAEEEEEPVRVSSESEEQAESEAEAEEAAEAEEEAEEPAEEESAEAAVATAETSGEDEEEGGETEAEEE